MLDIKCTLLKILKCQTHSYISSISLLTSHVQTVYVVQHTYNVFVVVFVERKLITVRGSFFLPSHITFNKPFCKFCRNLGQFSLNHSIFFSSCTCYWSSDGRNSYQNKYHPIWCPPAPQHIASGWDQSGWHFKHSAFFHNYHWSPYVMSGVFGCLETCLECKCLMILVRIIISNLQKFLSFFKKR